MCTIGRMPVSARPAPTLTSSCSRMPTLTTRSGWRALDVAEELAGDLGVAPAPTERSVVDAGRRRCGRTACAGSRVRVVSCSCSSSTSGDDQAFGTAEAAGGQGRLERVVVAPVDGRDLPALGREPLRDPAGHGVRRRAVVDDDHGEVRRARGPPRARAPRGCCLRRARRRRPARPRARRCPGRAGRAPSRRASGSPCPSEPDEISTPGTRLRSGWWPERRVEDAHDSQPRLGEEARSTSTA